MMNNKIDVKRKGVPIVISGAAGVGKGTILSELIKKNEKYKMSISATTRMPRPGEVHAVNYYFISKEEFQGYINENKMIEYVEYSGNFYGTPKDYTKKSLHEGFNLIFEIETVGAMNIKEAFPEAIMIFVLAPTYRELEKRLTERRTETKEIIQRRLEISKKEITYLDKYDYFLVNEHERHTEAAENLDKIINVELNRRNNSIINSKDEKILNKFAASQERISEFLKNYY